VRGRNSRAQPNPGYVDCAPASQICDSLAWKHRGPYQTPPGSAVHGLVATEEPFWCVMLDNITGQELT
jgi:hypothetical protein